MIYHIITPNYYESGLFMKVSENAFYELSFENIKILLKHLFGDDMFFYYKLTLNAVLEGKGKNVTEYWL